MNANTYACVNDDGGDDDGDDDGGDDGCSCTEWLLFLLIVPRDYFLSLAEVCWEKVGGDSRT